MYVFFWQIKQKKIVLKKKCFLDEENEVLYSG